MATRAVLVPGAFEPPSTNAAELITIHSTVRRPVLAYDAATDETARWTIIVPQGFTGTPTGIISYCMASDTTNDVVWTIAIEAVTEADAVDLDSATSEDTANSATDTVPGTAGYLGQCSITLTNYDSAAAADYFRVIVARDADNAADDAAGDAYLLAVEIRDTA